MEQSPLLGDWEKEAEAEANEAKTNGGESKAEASQTKPDGREPEGAIPNIRDEGKAERKEEPAVEGERVQKVAEPKNKRHSAPQPKPLWRCMW